MKTLATALIVLSVFTFTHQDECPFTPEDCIENYLGTKTPYRFVENKNESPFVFENCEALKIWMLIRHGTRNPSIDFITRMRERLPEIRDLILQHNTCANEYLRNSDLDNFRKWRCKLTDIEEKKLTHEGEDEMLMLAERMQSRYPNLLPPTYSNSTYKFRFTASQRTKQSAKYFVAGLFGRQVLRDVYFPPPKKDDKVLRFYKMCSKWRNQVKKKASTLVERQMFQKSQYMKIAIADVNARMNLTNELDIDDVHLMYQTCAFETAWNKRSKSPWCTPFNLSTIKVMEFLEQLKYYWVDGYGFELTYKQACPTLKDLVAFFNSTEKTKAAIYFTHSGTLLKVLAHLGLYKDIAPLTYTSFKTEKKIKWNVSKIDTFGSNLAFILYSCGDKKNKVLKVLTLHNERPIRLPPCPDEDLCDFSTILQHYEESIHNCAFDEMCQNQPPE